MKPLIPVLREEIRMVLSSTPMFLPAFAFFAHIS